MTHSLALFIVVRQSCVGGDLVGDQCSLGVALLDTRSEVNLNPNPETQKTYYGAKPITKRLVSGSR
jgi:hypothetical protein